MGIREKASIFDVGGEVNEIYVSFGCCELD
jgi:hypothetical protein